MNNTLNYSVNLNIARDNQVSAIFVAFIPKRHKDNYFHLKYYFGHDYLYIKI